MMKVRFSGKVFVIAIVVATLFVVYVLNICKDTESQSQDLPASSTTEEVEYAPHFFIDDYYRYITTVNRDKQDCVRGGVVPHHSIAGFMAVDLLERLGSCESLSVLILLGPNHLGEGDTPFISTGKDWNTAAGIVRINQELIAKVGESTLFSIDEAVFANEFSVLSLFPYIEHYLPSVTVLPLIVKADTTLDQLESFVAFLEEGYPIYSTAVVASADFAHEVSLPVGSVNSRVVQQMIRDRKWSPLLELGNDYLDSPESLVTLFLLLGDSAVEDHYIADESNSAEINGAFTPFVTTYMEIIIP